MKILVVLAVLILVAGIALSDVVLGALGAGSLLFAGAAVLAVRLPSPQPS